MSLDDLLKLLQQYRDSYPHRGINIKGEIEIHHGTPFTDSMITKVNLGPDTVPPKSN
jgi:hypothetical protein